MYSSPFPIEVVYKEAQPTGIYAHALYLECKYAVDYLIPINTPILACHDGIVWKTKLDSHVYGLDPAIAHEVNFVTVDHGNGTYAEYVHLKHEGIVVKPGQIVTKGELLGYSGLSGCMDFPHLHLNMFTIVDGKAISIPFVIS